MKTKLLLILIAFTTISGTCEADKNETQSDCNCEKGYYLYTPTPGGQGGNYVLQFATPIDFDCNTTPYGTFEPVSNVNYNYIKIDCQ